MTGDERLAKVAEVLQSQLRHYTLPANVAAYYGKDDNHNTVAERCGALNAEALAPLLDEFRAEDEARALREVKAVLDNSCHHCGIGPDDDGDHSCPCPNTDSECLEHLEYPVLPTNLHAALAAAEPDAGER